MTQPPGSWSPLSQLSRGLDVVRAGLGRAILAGVAGSEPERTHARIHLTPGPRWFPEDAPIRQVHGDASMFVGGIRALLIQSLHPLAMAGVAAHSDYRTDPWGRLQRTGQFLAVTTFGTAADAERAVSRVRAVHSQVRGVAPDGRTYSASDPHLLRWVHVTEADSFLGAYQRYGGRALTQAERDTYVAQTAEVAEALGSTGSPRTERAMRDQLAGFRDELRGTREAREAARFVLLDAPVPLVARPGYGVLAAAAVGLMPWWSRWPLRLPWLPVAEATLVRAAGVTATSGIRWAMSA